MRMFIDKESHLMHNASFHVQSDGKYILFNFGALYKKVVTLEENDIHRHQCLS